MAYQTVKIERGPHGWGGPLFITPSDEKPIIVSMCGDGLHPLAQKIAELSGGRAIDGFKTPVETNKISMAVVDCGGTARCGIYPKMGIPTLNINGGGPSGPFSGYCTKELYCTDGKIENITLATNEPVFQKAESLTSSNNEPSKDLLEGKPIDKSGAEKASFFDVATRWMASFGRIVGRIVNVILQASKDSLNMMLGNVIPFMIFISLISGIVLETGIGTAFANFLGNFTSNIWGLIILAIILAIPVISPLLAPGAVIESVLGVLVGNQIAAGIVPVELALPAFFMVVVVGGCDFTAVALALADPDADTTRLAVPSVLLTRFITAPIGVLIGWIFSIGLW